MNCIWVIAYLNFIYEFYSSFSAAQNGRFCPDTLKYEFHLNCLEPYFINWPPDLDGWIIHGTKIIKTGPFLWNGSSKIHSLLISNTFAFGGCWGQWMLFFWKLVDKTQLAKPPEHTRHHDSRQLLILLSLRAIYFSTFQYETPCIHSNSVVIQYR